MSAHSSHPIDTGTCYRTAVALASALALLIVVPSAQPGAVPSAPQVSMQVAVPPAIVPMDGRRWLIYELHLENSGAAAATLTSVEVADAATPSAPLAVFDGDELVRRLDVAPDRQAPLSIPAGSRRVVYIEVALRAAAPPNHLRHHVQFASVSSTIVGGVVGGIPGIRVDDTAPVVLGPPLASGPWVAVHHPDWERGHRRVFYTVDGVIRLPGRFTIDFVKIDDAGGTVRGDADLVANSLGYGAEVLAVADATVAATRDSIPEVSRVSQGRKHPQDEAAGNFVSLDLGDGRFAVYEHLKPGSIRVQPDQRVRRGDVVAQVGFTGDSTGPHLHLHVGDAAAPLGAEGLPFVFDRFEVLGRYPDIAAMGRTRWSTDGAGRRTNERPGSNTVVDFGSATPR